MPLRVSAAVALFCLIFLASCRQGPRSVVVGVDNSPPFYVFQPDGSVKGLGIDTLELAAKRSNIHIIWKPPTNYSLDRAMETRTVQMWPLVAVTPERKARFYFSQPWLQSDYVLVSAKGTPVRTAGEARGLTISHARLHGANFVADHFLPKTERLQVPTRALALEEMCRGTAAATLLELRVLDAMLLDRPGACRDTRLNVTKVPGATTPLAIMAVPEVADIARDLRAQIANMALNGEMGQILDQWAPFSAEGARSIWTEQASATKIHHYMLLAAALLISALSCAVAARRTSRLRRSEQAAQAEMRKVQLRFTEFMDHSPALAYIKDADGRIIYLNQKMLNTWNLQPEDWIGKTDAEIWPEHLARSFRENDNLVLHSGQSREFLEQGLAPDGSVRKFLSVKFPFEGEPGTVMIGGFSIDVTSRQQDEEALRKSEAFNRSILENTVDSIETLDREGNLLSSNFRLQVPRSIGERWASVWHEASDEDISKALASAARGVAMEFQATLRADRSRWFSVFVSPVSGLDGDGVDQILTVAREITSLKLSEFQLRQSEQRYRSVVEHAGDIIYQTDHQGHFTFCNNGALRVTGYTMSEVIGKSFTELIHPLDRARTKRFYTKQLKNNVAESYFEFRCVAGNGEIRWLGQNVQVFFSKDGRANGFQAIARDITDRKKAEQALEREAGEDALTCLPNRRTIMTKLESLLRTETKISLCMCDIDTFKVINDTYGHGSGDEVLRVFAGIIGDGIRKSDIAGRLGGDEFCIALCETDSAEAYRTINRIREKLATVAFGSGGKVFSVTATFGIAEWKPGMDLAQLFDAADSALYGAKRGGKNLVAATGPAGHLSGSRRFIG